MPCVHLHGRGHWTFYLVLYESFDFNISRRRVILCHWQFVIQLWNELENTFCFLVGEMLFLFLLRRNWFFFRVSLLTPECFIFWFGGLDWFETSVLTFRQIAALDRKLLNPSFHLTENMGIFKHTKRKLVANIFITSVKNSIKTWKLCLKFHMHETIALPSGTGSAWSGLFSNSPVHCSSMDSNSYRVPPLKPCICVCVCAHVWVCADACTGACVYPFSVKHTSVVWFE